MNIDNGKVKKISVDSTVSLIQALKKMDAAESKLLLVLDEYKFIGVLSIGDIQRSIISNISLNEPIKSILRPNPRVAGANEASEIIKGRMLEFRTEFMPVINDENILVDVIFWEDLFVDKRPVNNRQIDLPVVIMAGGKGERLKPITNVIPKPLIPIGEKTIMELIMDKFDEIGCKQFYASVNYKADFIKYYFDTLESKHFNIEYFRESKPLGTIGSLTLLKDIISTTFFVTNCDIIIDQDFREVYDYHVANGNEITVVSALKQYNIPYGILEAGKDGVMKSMNEKPDLTFMINSGVYILESHLISEIPENTFYHITQLIEKVIERKGKVGVFPVSEGAWRDIGDWDLFLQNNRIRLNK